MVAVTTLPDLQSQATSSPPSPAPESRSTAESTDAPTPEAGEKGFGGPGSVQRQVEKDDEPEPPLIPIHPLDWAEKELLDLRAKLRESVGLTLALDYNALVQGATESPGEDLAAGGVARLYGHWSWPGESDVPTGSLVFKGENRHRLGTDIAPQQLGGEVGYSALTAITWSDADWLLSNFYWHQSLFDNRFEFVAGVVDTTDYVDMYGLVNPWTDFVNSVFGNNASIGFPGQGLGAAFRAHFTPQVYLLAGIADGNGDPTEPWKGFETLFDDGELFKHFEVGWYSAWEKRFEDNIHFTLWQTDSRSDDDVPHGWGGALSASYLFADRWLPFVRGGLSDGGGGAPFEAATAVGVGYYLRGQSDLAAVGFHWGRLSSETYPSRSRDDEYTVEVLYRARLVRRVSVTPDIQVLIHPALDPDQDVLAVFGLRMRVVF